MSSNTKDMEEAVPASVIAQAEAAVAANNEDDEVAPPRRRRSTAQTTAQSFFSLLQDTIQDNIDNRNLKRSDTQASQLSNMGILLEPFKNPDRLDASQEGFATKAKVTDDGRVKIDIKEKANKLSNLLTPALKTQLDAADQEPLPPGYIPEALGGKPGQTPPPRLNVVIQVVGSRGDVQPFIALGKVLKSTYGHRVRLATHPTFQSFVEENGLEFFSIGGDPEELMAFMVKNPGLMPGMDALKSGEIGKRRKGMEQTILGCWRSCIEAGDGLGAPSRNSSSSSASASIMEHLGMDSGINMDTSPAARPFIADAIIANPPSFAHIHIAERLGIPLHIMFTMPWSPTQMFPHPLANIESSNTDTHMANFLSYAVVELLTWQGLGDIVNRFREKALGLEPISLMWAPGGLGRLKVPFTYCWSPELIPKPKDWGRNIDVSGFFFLNLASSYQPDPSLAEFLAGPRPIVYIGFGSIVVDNPNDMTTKIFEAVKKAGVRALVSKGWGGLGGNSLDVPDGVYMLGNVPHDWLFNHVDAVVHHGGAGTMSAGIAHGLPTVIVSFFGDQPFWGAQVQKAGAGFTFPFKKLTSDKLAEAITNALKPEVRERAQELGSRIRKEKGNEEGGKSFHDHLQYDDLRCSLAPSRVAVWRVKRTQTRLSALAATVLANEGLLDFADLKLYRPREYEIEDGPWDPLSGGAAALIGTMSTMGMGAADFPVDLFRAFKAKKGDLHEEAQKTPTVSSATPALAPRDSISRTGSNLNLAAVDRELLDIPGSSAPTTPTAGTRDASTVVSSTPATSTATTHHSKGASMKEALAGKIQSCSPSRSPSGRSHPGSRPGTPKKEFDPSTLTLDNAIGASKGLSRIVGAGLKSPMDFTLGLARGFHNAPKLYNDDTVRPNQKVTGIQSGLAAAGKEFGFGFYDGITGLVTQPMRGAEKEGASGLLKGFAKGVTGLVLKPGAAIWGLPGYTFMGINKEVQKLFGYSVKNYIITARTAEGHEHWKDSTEQERQEIINNWKAGKSKLQSPKQKILEQGGPEGQQTGYLSPRGFMQNRHLSFDERKKLHAARKEKRKLERGRSYGGHHPECPFCENTESHDHTDDPLSPSTDVPQINILGDEDEFERAIQASVRATSKGNPEEDKVIEKAIRASLNELRQRQETMTEDEAMNRAIRASVEEAKKADLAGTSDTNRASALEESLQESLTQTQQPSTSDDPPVYAQYESDGDEEMRQAMRASQTDFNEKAKAQAEEDVVIEYIKKQSLLEEEHRKGLASREP